MRFVKLAAKNFQAIEAADIEFGRGLNVLYGPNDLGKSTLACAIRAALLVPSYSSEAARYKPWFADSVPEVSLTFVDDDGHFWRVRKSFGGGGTQGSADLHHSKDGVTFSRDCGGREVDEKLREKLAWGIPSPGGKGAPKKLPTSFLANVLLAEQSDVETILSQSTGEDGTGSGRDRLRKALSALAEDPWFKKVLIETQKKVDALFTPTGQRKRGRGSPFALAAEDIKRRGERIEALKKAVAESLATEERVRRLQEQCAAARETRENASTALTTVRQKHARTLEAARAGERFAVAKAALAALEEQQRLVDERARALEGLERSVACAQRDLADMQAGREKADAAVRGAEEALRAATSDDGVRQRELTRAKLGAERAEVGEKLGRAEKRCEEIQAAQRALDAAEAAAGTKSDAERAVGLALEAVAVSQREFQKAEGDLTVARGIAVYGQWLAAALAAKQAGELRAAADALTSDATTNHAAAEEHEALAAQIEADANARRERLPDTTLAGRIVDLGHKITVAEAALGGGFSIAVRGAGKIPVHVTLDGRDAVAGTAVDGRLVLEADRSAALRVGDILDVEIVAGAAEKRRVLEPLRERWANEAQPVLERAGVKTPDEVRIRLDEVAELVKKAETARREAKQFRTAAEAARQAAGVKEQRVQELLTLAGESEALESKLGTLDRAALAGALGKLGAAWKQECERLIDVKEKTRGLAREALEKATRAHELDVYRATEAAKHAEAAAAEAERVRGTLAGEGPGVPLRRALAAIRSEIEMLASRRGAIDEELRTLDLEASTVVTAAKAAVDDAKAKQAQATERVAAATSALAEGRSVFDGARGELEVMRKALLSIDRGSVESGVARAQTEVDVYAGEPVVSEDEVVAAENHDTQAREALDALRAELNQAEGALTKVGGRGVREELAEEEKALTLAKEQQRDLELDADAWKLLRETLDVVEKDGASHLGRSLAAPVSARLAELTQGRYGAIRLDQHLRAETVDVPLVATEEDVLRALSVGTRDQIATLLRVTIAEQLKSAIVLDDHLVHTDPERLTWFRDLLRKTALTTQVVVLTCRPQDYVAATEYPDGGSSRDVAGGVVRTIDVGRVVRRWEPARTPSPAASTGNDAAREELSR